MSEKVRKFIPSLKSLVKAVEELPSAENIKSESYLVTIEDRRTIEFRKIKFKTATGKGYRWIYEGKIRVN